jgi:hypothetical protein
VLEKLDGTVHAGGGSIEGSRQVLEKLDGTVHAGGEAHSTSIELVESQHLYRARAITAPPLSSWNLSTSVQLVQSQHLQLLAAQCTLWQASDVDEMHAQLQRLLMESLQDHPGSGGVSSR